MTDAAKKSMPCNHFHKKGHCKFGDECKYSHTTAAPAPEAKAKAKAKAKAVVARETQIQKPVNTLSDDIDDQVLEAAGDASFRAEVVAAGGAPWTDFDTALVASAILDQREERESWKNMCQLSIRAAFYAGTIRKGVWNIPVH